MSFTPSPWETIFIKHIQRGNFHKIMGVEQNIPNFLLDIAEYYLESIQI